MASFFLRLLSFHTRVFQVLMLLFRVFSACILSVFKNFLGFFKVWINFWQFLDLQWSAQLMERTHGSLLIVTWVIWLTATRYLNGKQLFFIMLRWFATTLIFTIMSLPKYLKNYEKITTTLINCLTLFVEECPTKIWVLQLYTALSALLMMATESTLSKCPVTRATEALFLL